MHEKLVSYVLGELNAEEAAEFERELHDDPALAAEAERLSVCLNPAPGRDGEDPNMAAPLGLADRTADSVTILTSELRKPSVETTRVRYSFSLLDAAVAIGVVAAVAMMLLPALRESRDSARRNVCQYHMKEIGQALKGFADDRGGYFPTPPPNMNVGTFTIMISRNGYIDREHLAELVVCPGSPEADQVAAGELEVRIPGSFEELEMVSDATLTHLRRVMALNLAYRLACKMDKNVVHPIANCRDCRAPLLSDAPTIVDGRWQSLNHGDALNVLYQDLSVRSHVDFRDPVRDDHFFVNTEGHPSMPTSPHDAVLVRSEYVPMPDGMPKAPQLLRVGPDKALQPGR